MKTSLNVAVSLLALSPLASYAQAAANGAQPATGHNPTPISKTASPAIAAAYSSLPMSFEANRGQTDPQVRFLSHGQGYSLFLTDSAAVLALTGKSAQKAARDKPARQTVKGLGTKTDAIRMKLAGASESLRVDGAEPLEGKVNYFLGNDPAKWHSNVPTYQKVKYTGVYPGVDLVYYGNQGQLEYDFIVAANADPKPVRLQIAGAARLKLDDNGDLNIISKNGTVAFHKPVVYQMKDARREPVDGSFRLLAKNTVGFRLGDYDHTRELVIDPVVAYSTYLGGKGAPAPKPYESGDEISSIAVDNVGNTYVAGTTYSPNFPLTAHAFDKTPISTTDSYGDPIPTAFVTKLDSAGNHLLFSTYFGGAGNGTYLGISAIAVDSSYNVYLAGNAVGPGFPITPGAYQTTNPSNGTGFVSKLNPNGSALIFSTLMGGTGVGAVVAGMALDSSGNTYLTGTVSTPDAGLNNPNIPSGFPTTHGAYLTSFTPDGDDGAATEGFVTKMNPTGTALVYSTFLGAKTVSEEGTRPFSLSVDAAGNAYIGGYTYDVYPITAGAYAQTSPVADGDVPGFATKLNPAGSALVYSTYLPTYKLVADSSGFVYGYSTPDEGTFPVTAGAFMTGTSNYVLKLNQAGSALVYGTYTTLGQYYEAVEQPSILAVAPDNAGNLLITGVAYDDSVPVTPDAFQSTYVGFVGGLGRTDNAYLQKISADGTTLLYGTYLGGRGDYVRGYDGLGDSPYAIAVDAAGNTYIAGGTYSHDFPVTPGAYQTVNKSPKSSNGFITKFAFAGGTKTTLTSDSATEPAGAEVTLSAYVAILRTLSGTVNTLPSVAPGVVPTGTITFFVDGQTAAKIPVDEYGDAVFNIDRLTVGAHTVEASYDGDVPRFSASGSAPLTITITPAP